MTTSHNNVQNPISEEQQTPSNFDLLTQQRCLKLNLRTDHHWSRCKSHTPGVLFNGPSHMCKIQGYCPHLPFLDCTLCQFKHIWFQHRILVLIRPGATPLLSHLPGLTWSPLLAYFLHFAPTPRRRASKFITPMLSLSVESMLYNPPP